MSKQWTPESIYLPHCVWMPAKVDRGLIITMPQAFKDEFLTAYGGESQWEPIRDVAPVTDLHGIIWDKEPCPICGQKAAAGNVYKSYRGVQTGIEVCCRSECACARARAFAKSITCLPLLHRAARLATIQPTDRVTVSQRRQQQSINFLRTNKDSVILCGTSKSGKSHLAAAVFTQAVEEWTASAEFSSKACPAIFADTKALLDEWMTYNSSRNSSDRDRVAAVPHVTPGKAKAASHAGLRPTLVLDDFHQMKPTEARVAQLVSLLKAYRDEDARVVIASSLPRKELAAKWNAIPGVDELAAWMNGTQQRLIVDRKENTDAA